MEHVDHVELDREVIETCREFFSWGHAWDDPRVELHIADGSEFVRNASSTSYDVIIQDSSDPSTWDEHGALVELPSSVLYESDHFRRLYRILHDDGVFSFQVCPREILRTSLSAVSYSSLALDTFPSVPRQNHSHSRLILMP